MKLTDNCYRNYRYGNDVMKRPIMRCIRNDVMKRPIRKYKRNEVKFLIAQDLLVILQQDYNKIWVKRFIEKKYNLEFDDEKDAWNYIRKLVNKYIPDCVRCGKARFKSTVFTLLCKDCYSYYKHLDEEIRLKWKEDFDKSPKDFIGSNFEEIIETHGDIYNIETSNFGRLGTTDFGPHKNKTNRSEQKTIAYEFKKLDLQPERKRH